ncbi:Disulphide bond corrector protein DsbC [Dyadobacter soli]|uniref:Disulphide bond corrector protein DsbC n=1 Tax=Dyadobacter soli TaxID=659014 RepID=A0A1G7KV49_9BACT|nr:protein-disulfide reductase DsbD domain-containing protein [Dyadobacter soli]SDF41138.1 Disulphide bond corrector protein DsbC [Dyadobacter soli]
MIYRVLMLVLCCSAGVFAQDLKDISRWKVSLSKSATQAGEEVEVVFSADINKNWKLYSSDFKGDIGPLPTEFAFDTNNAYQLVGDIRAVKPLKAVDPTWDKAYTYFVDKAEFRQTIKLAKRGGKVSGTIKGLLCSNEDGLCVPFKESFEVQ